MPNEVSHLKQKIKRLFGIGIVAISIGLISKKVINYPAGGCMKGTQEITFNIYRLIIYHFLFLKSSQL